MYSGGALKPNSGGVYPNSVAGINKQQQLANQTPYLNSAGNYGWDPITGAPITDVNAAKAMLDPKSEAFKSTAFALKQGFGNAATLPQYTPGEGEYRMAPRNNGGPMTPVGQTPYTPGMSGYQRTGFRAPIKSGRSRLDPERIAGKMARGTARPGEVAAAEMMLKLPGMQAKAEQARLMNSLTSDPRYQNALRKQMEEALNPQDENQGGTKSNGVSVPLEMFDRPTTPRTTADYTAKNGGLSPQRPSTLDATYAKGGMTRPTSSYQPPRGTTRAEGGSMRIMNTGLEGGARQYVGAAAATRAEGGEMEMGDDEGGEGEEDAYLLGEEGPEMVIKRDNGSMFVLPADVTEKIMAGITMEDTEDNQDAMAAAMQRMGMEPKMGGGKMKPYMKGGKMGTCMCGGKMGSCMCGGKMKARMGGGPMGGEPTSDGPMVYRTPGRFGQYYQLDPNAAYSINPFTKIPERAKMI
jgi:hypothetical protein